MWMTQKNIINIRKREKAGLCVRLGREDCAEESGRDLPGGSAVKTSHSNSRGAGLIPGWGAKIPYALWSKKQNITEAIL